ncbi:MAG TPA: MFS transporter, partial [Verrucomicrobiae bacterium]|nr:MFS transporter [Verrucomicrobiae bacterium]
TLPPYVISLGGTASQVGLVMGFFTIASVLLRPRVGRAADARGRKFFLMIGAATFAVIPFLYAIVTNPWQLYIVRVIHGLGHAGYTAASSAFVADLAPPHRRGEVIGVYGTMNIFSMALAPAVGSYIVNQYSYSTLFLVAAVTGLVALLCVSFIHEEKREAKEVNSEGFLETLKQKPVLVPSMTLLSSAIAYGSAVTFLPVFVLTRDLTNSGIFFVAYSAATFASRILTGKLSDKIGRRRVIIPSMVILFVGVAIIPLIKTYWLMGLAGTVLGFGFGSLMPTLNAMVVDKVPPHKRGGALATFTSFMDIGIGTGSVAMGFAAKQLGYPNTFWVASILILLGWVYFILNTREA